MYKCQNKIKNTYPVPPRVLRWGLAVSGFETPRKKPVSFGGTSPSARPRPPRESCAHRGGRLGGPARLWPGGGGRRPSQACPARADRRPAEPGAPSPPLARPGKNGSRGPATHPRGREPSRVEQGRAAGGVPATPKRAPPPRAPEVGPQPADPLRRARPTDRDLA